MISPTSSEQIADHTRQVCMNASGELVSIIIPTYNRAHYLRECVESAFAQTYRPLEVIVVDDGSTDNTHELLKSIEADAAGREGVTFRWQVVSNGGAPRARNKGFELSHGEYVMFLDSDDRLLPHKIETEVRALSESGGQFVYSYARRIDETGQPTGKIMGKEPSAFTYLNLPWQTMCALYRREFLLKMGLWDEGLPMWQDYEFSYRALVHAGRSFCFTKDICSEYRVHDGERIGKKDNAVVLAQRRLPAMLKVYQMLIQCGKASIPVKIKFGTRFAYILLLYLGAKERLDARRLLSLIRENDETVSLFLCLISWIPSGFARTLLKLRGRS